MNSSVFEVLRQALMAKGMGSLRVEIICNTIPHYLFDIKISDEELKSSKQKILNRLPYSRHRLVS